MARKTGEDMLTFNPPRITSVDKSFTLGNKYKEDAKERVLAVLSNAERPLNVAEIDRHAEIFNWNSTKQILIDLETEGRVEHFRSGRYIMFRLKQRVV